MKTIFSFVFCVLLVAAFGMSGCKSVSLPTAKGYTDLCQTYVGGDSDRLINAWGIPGRTFDAKNQNKVLVYVETRDEYTLNPLAHSALIEYPPRVDPRTIPRSVNSKGVIGQPVDSMDYCITYFEVNPQDKITKAIWRGDCRALESSPADQTDVQE